MNGVKLCHEERRALNTHADGLIELNRASGTEKRVYGCSAEPEWVAAHWRSVREWGCEERPRPRGDILVRRAEVPIDRSLWDHLRRRARRADQPLRLVRSKQHASAILALEACLERDEGGDVRDDKRINVPWRELRDIKQGSTEK